MALVEPDFILSGIKRIISTDKAPAAIGPYSQAVQAGHFLYVSGQIPVNPVTGEVPEDIAAQTRQSLENLKAILETAGYTLGNVVKTTIFAANINNFAAVNQVYAEYFAKEAPARSFVAVKDLPKGVGIEIEAVAWRE